MKQWIALMVLGLAAQAQAATYYFSDCQSGADPVCVVGSNANNGTSASTPFQTTAAISITGLPAGGHTLLFAKGSAQNFTGLLSLNYTAATSATPLIVAGYTPGWGAGTAKPILRFALNGSDGGIWWYYRGNTRITGFDIRGPGYDTGTGSGGIGLYVLGGGSSNIIIDDVIVRGFQNGVTFDPGLGALSNLTLKNSTISNNGGQGFYGGGNNGLLENNIFDQNGFNRTIYDHNVYLDSSIGMTVRGNTLTRNARFGGGGCSAVSLVAHGLMPNLTIENNKIIEETTALDTCFGIEVNTYTDAVAMGFQNLIIRGNIVTNGGNAAISCNACPDALIENNSIVFESGTTATDRFGIYAGTKVGDGNDLANGKATVRNNSIYVNGGSIDVVAVRMGNALTGGEVTSNMVYFTGSVSSGAACFDTGGKASSAFTNWSNNLCYRNGGAVNWMDGYATLAAAQAVGFDANSLNTDPTLVYAPPATGNNWSMAVQAGSPAINAGHPTKSSRRAIYSAVPVGARDIGAHDYGASNITPATPTRGTVN